MRGRRGNRHHHQGHPVHLDDGHDGDGGHTDEGHHDGHADDNGHDAWSEVT